MWLWVILGIIIFFGFMAFTGAPYVPSKPSEVRRAFTELYKLTKKDLLVDIGAGDGVVLRIASSRGARAVGYEINPLLALVAQLWSYKDPRVTVAMANFWHAEMPADTTVVYTFGDARDIARMYHKVQQEASRLGRSLHFITYGFAVPGISPLRTVGAHHLYTVRPLQGSAR